jgi:hypothetical protein
MSEALLSVRDLSVEFTTYGQTNKVLQGVSLDVPARSAGGAGRRKRLGQVGHHEGHHGAVARRRRPASPAGRYSTTVAIC